MWDFEEILSKVNKPARYIGNEINSIKKDLKKCTVSVALCFPDLYEIGMSHLGIRILYALLNQQTDIVCERVFSPAKDLENILRQKNIPLFSLESRLPLKEFDLLGFSLAYELNYTNVLNILDLAGLALKQSERKDTFPLVVGGGNCSLNPEPVAEFFDFFLIGEAEEAILETVEVVKDYKLNKIQRGYRKKDLLYQLAQIEGVYVPSFYNLEYDTSGSLKQILPNEKNIPLKIKKRIVKNLDTSFYPTQWIIPYISIIHDRIGLEIMRGCPHQCFFCQARSTFWPLRIRSPQKVIEICDSLYRSSGYEEVSLLSLSSSDYPYISEVVKSLGDKFKDDALALSLPSLRAKSVVDNLAESIAKTRKTTLTFAPEAGTERLRSVINKNFDLESLFNAMKNARRLGYRQIKLYFMIGLPQETKEDLDGIIDLISCILKENELAITLSVSNFIPKSHTPFQWLGMESVDDLKQKQEYLRSNLKHKRSKIKVDFHDVYMSYIEAVLARGDRRLDEAVLCAFKSGARFDSWSSEFKFSLWQSSFKKSNIDPDFYSIRKINPEELLAWGHIDCGIDKEISETLKI